MDFEVPRTVDAGSTMCLRARLEQHQLPDDVLALAGGLPLRVPFRVPRGGLVGGREFLGFVGRVSFGPRLSVGSCRVWVCLLLMLGGWVEFGGGCGCCCL